MTATRARCSVGKKVGAVPVGILPGIYIQILNGSQKIKKRFAKS